MSLLPNSMSPQAAPQRQAHRDLVTLAGLATCAGLLTIGALSSHGYSGSSKYLTATPATMGTHITQMVNLPKVSGTPTSAIKKQDTGMQRMTLHADLAVTSISRSQPVASRLFSLPGIFGIVVPVTTLLVVMLRLRQKFSGRLPEELSPMCALAVSGESATGKGTQEEGRWTFVMTEAALNQQPNSRAQGNINGVDIALIKEGGKLYATQARCPHLGIPMAGGKVENGVITCSQHKSRWSCNTGDVVEWLPGGGFNAVQRLVSPACGLAVYETKVEEGKIYVDLQPKL